MTIAGGRHISNSVIMASTHGIDIRRTPHVVQPHGPSNTPISTVAVLYRPHGRAVPQIPAEHGGLCEPPVPVADGSPLTVVEDLDQPTVLAATGTAATRVGYPILAICTSTTLTLLSEQLK